LYMINGLSILSSHEGESGMEYVAHSPQHGRMECEE